MCHRLLCTYPQSGSTHEQLLQEVPAFRIQAGHDLTPGRRHVVHGEGLVVGQLTDPWPRLFRGRAKEFEDSLQLINDVGTGEKGTSCIGQFGKYASSGPHVDAGRVELCAKEHVRWSVPQSDHLG